MGINIKKISIPLFLFVFIDVSFAQIRIPDFVYAYGEPECLYVGNENRLYECDTYNKKYRDITNQLYIDDYGYMHIRYNVGETTYFTIKPGDYFLLLSPKQYFSLGDYFSDLKGVEKKYGFENLFIKSITSKSYITEKQDIRAFEYKPENLLRRFFASDSEFRYEFWPNTLPWAFRKDEKQREELVVEFTENVSGLLILNGFVDFYRPNLYRQNSRIKNITIIGVDDKFEMSYDLADVIQFQEVLFPRQVSKIIMRVNTVYDGSKYSDVCLSGISSIFTQDMVRESKQYNIQPYSQIIEEMFKTYKQVK